MKNIYYVPLDPPVVVVATQKAEVLQLLRAELGGYDPIRNAEIVKAIRSSLVVYGAMSNYHPSKVYTESFTA